MASGKRSKQLRKWARKSTTEHGKELVSVKGTSRVITSVNGNKVVTETKAHPRGSYRNVLKLLKGRGGYDLFNPATNSHELAAA